MEFTFTQLKQKEVINLNDGKNLGKVCDASFTWPENKFTGITVTGCRGFKFGRQDVFIPVCDITKIGEDTVLVKLGGDKPGDKPPKPPHGGRPNCPPPCPPHCPPCPPDRRSYDEYE